jgi:hypothetical protein
MVMLKPGVKMTPQEKKRFDEDNARPRKKAGRVDYYFKPKGTYPARIYVFMHAEMWPDRNRRPMGLAFSHAFLSRPMHSEEIEYHHFDFRLCYHQYNSFAALINAEEKEVEFLETEMPGVGIEFMAKLKTFKSFLSR